MCLRHALVFCLILVVLPGVVRADEPRVKLYSILSSPAPGEPYPGILIEEGTERVDLKLNIDELDEESRIIEQRTQAIFKSILERMQQVENDG